VSRLFPDSVVVGLAPSQITLGRRSALACDPALGSEPWHGAVAALHSAPLANCRITVELSSHFVRYAVVPWSNALATAQEEEAYARHHFAKIHGERAKHWVVRASEAARGAPRLASAVDRGLLEQLRAAVKGKPRARLVSIQPQLMSRFNAWRQVIPPQGAWVVLAEPDRACVALHDRAGWRSVQNARGDWRALLDRERARADADAPDVVLLGGASAPAGDGAWRFREMAA